MNTEESRNEFEKWFKKDFHYEKSGPYVKNMLLEAWQAAKAQAVPEGWKLVQVEPTGEQWSGLARDIIFWLRSDSHQTPESLIEFLKNIGNEIPSWLTDEPEMKNSQHVISKGTIAAIIYKAMLAAAPEQNK